MWGFWRRDRLYALLSLSTEADRSAITVSYSDDELPDHVLQITVTIHFLRQINALLPLNLCCHKELAGLPSWTTDWCLSRRDLMVPYDLLRDSEEVFNACGKYRKANFKFVHKPQVNVPLTQIRMLVRGWIVDEIVFADALPECAPSRGFSPTSTCFELVRKSIFWSRAGTLWDRVRDLFHIDSMPLYKAGASDELWDAVLRTMTTNKANRSWGKMQLQEFLQASQLCHRRSFIITERGFLGLAPAHWAAATRPGDLVCVLYGGPTPFILRPIQDEEHLPGSEKRDGRDQDGEWQERQQQDLLKELPRTLFQKLLKELPQDLPQNMPPGLPQDLPQDLPPDLQELLQELPQKPPQELPQKRQQKLRQMYKQMGIESSTESSRGRTYSWVGPAYVGGIMHGEWVAAHGSEEERQPFEII